MKDVTENPPEEVESTTDQSSQGLSPKGMSAMQGSNDIPVSPSIPDYTPGEGGRQPSDWKNLGIINVPVADLPDPDGVNSPDDFNHHISWEDAKSAALQLPQIQNEVALGKTGDDFYAEDQAVGLDWRHGRKRVYDLYYSDTDPIQVDKDGNQYTINSGRHRIYAAKALGLETVPLLVREKNNLLGSQGIPISNIPADPSLQTIEERELTDGFIHPNGGSVSPLSTTLSPDVVDLNNINRIKSSAFSQEIKASLAKDGLNNFQSVLNDNTGRKAEQLSRIVIGQQGLPDGSGGFIQFQSVIPGQYNDQGNGIDLVGITPDGKPVPIEIKKRADVQKDTIGKDSITKLNDETKTLLENIELERRNNPVLAKNLAERKSDEPDPEMSSDQMSDLWLRDRWISLIKNKKDELEQAVSQEYLDLDTLVQHPYSDAWKQILNSKHTVIVSSNKDNVSNTLLREAILRKGFDVSVIDLGT